MPGGTPVGWREKGAGEGIQTVTKPEFDTILNNIIKQGTPIDTPINYGKISGEGQYYQMPDGSIVGIRNSVDNDTTIDIIKSNIKDSISKIHKQQG